MPTVAFEETTANGIYKNNLNKAEDPQAEPSE
jgi:hypothetical protein